MHKRYTLVTWSLPGFHVNVLLPAQRWLLLTPTCSASPCGCWSATWAHSSWYLVPVVCMEIVLSYWNSSKQGNGTGCLSWSVHSPALTGLSVPVGQHGVVVPINGSCARTASSDGLSWPPPPLEIEILLWFCTEVHVIALVSSKFLLFSLLLWIYSSQPWVFSGKLAVLFLLFYLSSSDVGVCAALLWLGIMHRSFYLLNVDAASLCSCSVFLN